MAYVVSARKWRPQVFNEIVGQPHIVTTLTNAVKTDRVASAYLFSGTRGVGKTTTARIFSKAMNCINGPTDDPCGTCKFCREIKKGISLDVIEIDGASNRGIDDIRNIKENVQYAPTPGKYKIYIIDEVHMLTKEAFNALLKTLEEPPGKVLFIFATTEINKVPDTILSRCQWFEFKALLLQDIVNQLLFISKKDTIDIHVDHLQLIAQHAHGSMRDAQMLFDQVVSFAGTCVKESDVRNVLGLTDRKVVENMVDSIIKKDYSSIISNIKSVSQSGCDIKLFYMELVTYFRDLMVVKVLREKTDSLILKSPGECTQIKLHSEKFSEEQLHQIFNLLLTLEEELKNTSFPEVLFEMTLIKLSQLAPLLPVEDVLEKIEDIECMLQNQYMQGLLYTKESNNACIDNKSQISGTGDQKPLVSGVEAKKEEDGTKSKIGTATSNIKKPIQEEKISKPTGDFGSIKDNELEQKWAKLKDEVGKKRPLLVTVLDRAKIVSIKKNIVLALDEKESLYIDVIKKAENVKIISQAAHKILGKQLEIKIEKLKTDKKENSPGGKEGGSFSFEDSTEKKIIEEAIDIFKGSIV